MKKLLSRRILLVISILAAGFLFYLIYQLKMLPFRYFILIFAVVFGLIFLFYAGEKDKEHHHSMRVVILKLLHIALSVVMLVASISVLKGSNFLNNITGGSEQTIEMNVVVLKDSSYKKLEDLKDVSFGANTALDAISINKTETLIEEDIGDIEVTNYESYNDLLAALNDKKVEAMIVKAIDNDSLSTIEPNYKEKTRIIQTYELKVPSVAANSAEVTKEPFHIFISGADKRGPISTFALSDVDMIVTVNPTTKQIYLTSIPRDYYVDIYKVNEDGTEVKIGKDKLTHSAKFGIQSTIRTVEKLMGIKINYYAKFNFTSFVNVVDALGGITIDIPHYDVIGRDDGVFITRKGKFTMKPGEMDMTAEQALSFVRERYAFAGGDTVRGKNQMIMIKAIVKKCCSPAIITKMDGVFESLASCFETNMSADDIKALINMQLDDNAAWDIQSYHLNGDIGERVFYLATIGDVTSVNPKGLWVAAVDEDSVKQAKEYMDVIMSGEILKIKDDE